MNSKISLSELSEKIASATGFDTKACGLFIHELFTVVAETLTAGENVKIKGIGSFKVTIVEERKSVNVNTGEQMIIPSHRKVSFTPDKALADAVNAPFSMFEPIELSDNVTEDMLAIDNDALSEDVDDNPIPPVEVESATIQDEKAAVESQIITEQESAETEEILSAETPQPPAIEHHTDAADEIVSQQDAIVTNEETADEHQYVESVDTHNKSYFGKGVLVGIIGTVATVIIAMLAWWLLAPESLQNIAYGIHNENQDHPVVIASVTPSADNAGSSLRQETTESDGNMKNDTAAIQTTAKDDSIDVPTEVSDKHENNKNVNKDKQHQKPTPEIFNDKITKRRYLTTMAREYYGNYNLWPLIYDYNKNLGHPDRIRPGTKIKVPSAETLGIDPKDKAVIDKAKKRGVQIYNKYR